MKQINAKRVRDETRLDTNWELCKKLYMHNLESILAIKMLKIICDFEKQTDNLLLVRQTDWLIVKEKCRKMDFVILPDPRVKIDKSEKRNHKLDLARELKKYNGIWKGQW